MPPIFFTEPTALFLHQREPRVTDQTRTHTPGSVDRIGSHCGWLFVLSEQDGGAEVTEDSENRRWPPAEDDGPQGPRVGDRSAAAILSVPQQGENQRAFFVIQYSTQSSFRYRSETPISARTLIPLQFIRCATISFRPLSIVAEFDNVLKSNVVHPMVSIIVSSRSCRSIRSTRTCTTGWTSIRGCTSPSTCPTCRRVSVM